MCIARVKNTVHEVGQNSNTRTYVVNGNVVFTDVFSVGDEATMTEFHR